MLQMGARPAAPKGYEDEYNMVCPTTSNPVFARFATGFYSHMTPDPEHTGHSSLENLM